MIDQGVIRIVPNSRHIATALTVKVADCTSFQNAVALLDSLTRTAVMPSITTENAGVIIVGPNSGTIKGRVVKQQKSKAKDFWDKLTVIEKILLAIGGLGSVIVAIWGIFG